MIPIFPAGPDRLKTTLAPAGWTEYHESMHEEEARPSSQAEMPKPQPSARLFARKFARKAARVIWADGVHDEPGEIALREPFAKTGRHDKVLIALITLTLHGGMKLQAAHASSRPPRAHIPSSVLK